MAIPFGCGVYFKPSSTQRENSAAEPALSFGIFLGYRIAPGGKWNKEYLIADLDSFCGKDLSANADRGQFWWGSWHIVKQVKLSDKGIHFPLKERYDWFNTTLEGKEKHHDQIPVVLNDIRDREITEKEILTQEGPALYTPPPKSKNPNVLDAKFPYGYHTDSIGRKYPLDEFGNRVYKSRRPSFMPPEEWKVLSESSKERILAHIAAHPEEFRDIVQRALLGPAVPAETDWNDCCYYQQKFEASFDMHA